MLFICLSPSQKPCTSNFKKYFYFQIFSPAYLHLKNSVLQTSKNASNSTPFDRPISSSPFCFSKYQKIILFESPFIGLPPPRKPCTSNLQKYYNLKLYNHQSPTPWSTSNTLDNNINFKFKIVDPNHSSAKILNSFQKILNYFQKIL